MKKFVNEVNQIMRAVLADRYHEGWEAIFEMFFTYLINSNAVSFDRLVADAVTDYLCEALADTYELSHKEIEIMYSLYENYADRFKYRVCKHISNKVYYGDLCEVA